MIAARLGAQHKLETMARRLGQLRDGTTAAAQHVAYFLTWCDEIAALEQGHAVAEGVEKARAALVAVQIDLESTIFAIESAQLRATNTARLVAGCVITLQGADYEVQ